MSHEEEVSLPILEQIFEEMFKNMEEEEVFDDKNSGKNSLFNQ